MTDNETFRGRVQASDQSRKSATKVTASYQKFVEQVVKRHPDLKGLKPHSKGGGGSAR